MSDRLSVPLPKFKILGQSVHLAPNYVEWLVSRLQQGIGTHVVTMNAEIIMQANHNPQLAEIIDRADLVTPDGTGVILALRLHGIEQIKCAGIELGETLLQIAGTAQPNYPVFFYGGKPEVVAQAAANWQAKLPNLNIVGIHHGYLNSQVEQAELVRQLEIHQPKLIFVALGVPRQELWIRDRIHLCPQAIWVGVGGSFDVWSGLKNRAPRWIQNLNLEWLYRFAQEPSRWQRMFALPQFALLAMGERVEKGKILPN